MEVILLDDVEPLGHEGDIVRVADGHARNYLIPKSLAVKATKTTKAELEHRRGSIALREEHKAESAGKIAEELREQPLEITAKAGTAGRLHGSVTTQQIAEALAEQTGVSIDRRRITLVEPIRLVGDYLVTAQVYKGVDAQLAVKVVGEVDESAEEEEELEEAPEEGAAEEAVEEPTEEAASEAPAEEAVEEPTEEAASEAAEEADEE